jgi:hypothetical protein
MSQELKKFINMLVNEDEAAAKSALSQYILNKTREIVGPLTPKKTITESYVQEDDDLPNSDDLNNDED